MAAEQRPTGPQNLILENRKRLSVSGVEEVDGFDESYIRMRTSLGVLIVRGEELHMESLSADTGETLVTGHIMELAYEESRVGKGFFFRLFRGNERESP